MISRSLTLALRVSFALEFAGALGAWALGACVWPLAGAVASGTLVGFLLTFEEPRGEPCTPGAFYCACPGRSCCGCCNPTTAPCGRGRR